MKLIGEKINGTRSKVAAAIAGRDRAAIEHLATAQAEAGADWLDLNAGTHPSSEPDDLAWLVETVQAVVDVPLCLDSANPDALRRALRAVDRTPMINSISGEPDRLDGILPLVAESGGPVIALALERTRIPATTGERLDVIGRILERTRDAGVADDRLYVDPLAMSVATDTTAGLTTLDTIRTIRAELPEVHLTLGLSNISFGLPARSRLNRTFLALAMGAGLDSVILDPLDREARATVAAADTLLGQDRHCLRYIKAARAGLLDPAPAPAPTPASAT